MIDATTVRNRAVVCHGAPDHGKIAAVAEGAAILVRLVPMKGRIPHGQRSGIVNGRALILGD
jgi:hypothetical protein